ncbi:RHS repeat domain-containing protein [Micromonospora sp. NPDC047730]|uniref:RHS repeat domain-containing protein n=1 Tax=Micromonospora sp. NPDC047730 TaxID=3364253 RepID=UPI003724B5C8
MQRHRVWLAAAVASILIVGLLHAPPAQAAPSAGAGRPQVTEADRPVRGEPIAVRSREPDPATRRPAPPAPVWPAAGETPAVRADGAARVRVLDRAAARRAGVAGLLFTVEAAGAATVRVDYSGFAGAYGGSYGSRLRLVQLPGCAVTTPELPQCRTGTPLAGRHDRAARTLTGQTTAGVTVLAAVAGAASDRGDFTATSLMPSATWQAGGNSGAFSWSYPLRVPPVPGDLVPNLTIGYSSGTIDGRASNTNNQPSWVGEGFDLWPGYIERSYKSCADDGAPTVNGVKPGDLCWAYDNATVTWNGRGGELVKAGDGTWRLKNDDGTRFEKVIPAEAVNGDDDGEYWKATTTDGTQYFFGRHRLPGWSTGRAQTNSAWTVPVFGNNDGEPCHDPGGFAGSSCQQAWRWNLDYVVDPHGNAVTYHYTTETNRYGRNVSLSTDSAYDRGGVLNRIEYGLRADNLFASPPAKVLFQTAERCVPDATFDCAASKISDSPDRWPDVPWDQNCTADCTKKGLISPTFWSRYRLTGVTTQIRQASGAYRDVDSWALTHAWGDADIDRALLLQSIQQTGKAGSPAVTLPKITFNHVQLKNRLDRTGDDIPPFIKYRLGAIFDEYGGQLDIKYSEVDCSLDALPVPETNTRRCFPIWWQPAGQDAPIRDWFHKYVVTQVIRADRTARAPDMVTSYDYVGGAAWHFDDDDGLTRNKQKTWSQWRGYGEVRVTTGGINQPLTRDDYRYLRGMDGDRLNTSGGTKSVTVSDGEGGTHTDHPALAGFELKHTTYTAPDGVVHDKTVNTPWRQQTAIRSRSWGTTTANLTGVGTTRTWTALDGGAWRQTRVDTTYDPVTAVTTQVDDQGDTGTTADDRCTRTTYAVNATAWLRALPSRVETVAKRCASTPDRATDVISDVRTYYDGGALGAAPVRGDATRVEEIAAHDGTTARYVPTALLSYDAYGRPTTVLDAGDKTTTRVYAETAGLTTRVTTTGPRVRADDAASAHVMVEERDPAWGVATGQVANPDPIAPNARRTVLAYDALGRLSKVWRPGREGATVPDLEHSYQVAEGQIVAITTRSLTANGGQRVSQQLLDGLLRGRQTQTEGPGGGRLITDMFYDSRGNVARTYDTYYATGAPSGSLFGVAVPGDVESQTSYSYDGLNRKTIERFLVGNNDTQEKWRTVTSYGGDWVAVDPPVGGTPTRTIMDARGRTTELRQYHGDAPTGTYTATRYTYTPSDHVATRTDAGGNVWSNSYDLRGRLTRSVDPDRGTTTSSYDDLGRLTSTTNARGQKLVHRYDPLGRRTETREGSDTGPLRASWTYDTPRRGLLTEATRYTGGQAYTTRIDAYDHQDRPVRVTVVVPASEGPLAGSYTFTTAYNPDGTVQSDGFPAAGGLSAETVTRGYDGLARPTTLTSNLGSYLTGTAYSATGSPLQYELTAGGKKVWQTFAWEYGTGRLASSRTEREGISGVDRNASYTYNPAGVVTALSDVSRSGTDTQCFVHDHLQRLTEAWSQPTTGCASAPSGTVVGGPAPYWHSYQYDATGNRTREVLHGIAGQADTERTYQVPGTAQGHRLAGVTQTGGAGDRTDSFGYDATGNLTTRTVGAETERLAWDAEGALTSITEGDSLTSFVYGAGGERLIRRDDAGHTLYLPGMELHVPAGATVANGTRYYSHQDQPVAMRTITGVRFLTADHQGTAQLTIDAASQALTQRRFTPFGAERGAPTAWPNGRGFVGGVEDPGTELIRLGAREYDPATGRFVSVDPLLVDDPQQLDGYSYARSSPVTNSDPSGLASCGGGGDRWELASYGGSSRCDDNFKDFFPRPGRGGGGGGGGGWTGGGGGGGGWSGGGGGGGYRSPRPKPPPIGPVRVCEGWCAIKDKIGDQREVPPPTDHPGGITCYYQATPQSGCAAGPSTGAVGFPGKDMLDDFVSCAKRFLHCLKRVGKGMLKTCKKNGFACLLIAEELLAPLIVGGAFMVVIVTPFCLASVFCGVAVAVGVLVGVIIGAIVAWGIGRYFYDKGGNTDKPSHPDS